MNDKAALLSQLKIDHSARPLASATPRWPWLAGGALLVAATVGFVLLRGPGAVEIQVAQARSVGAAAAGSSVLDASGYVVARRQATVSSKVTGKVTDVLIEEGQQVKAGQVLARIDDSNARASLSLAQAQSTAARAALSEVRVQLADAERQLNRTRELAEKKLVAQSSLDTAQATVDGLKARLDSVQSNAVVAEKSAAVQGQLLEDTVIRAPFDGVITQKNAQPGEMISPLSAGGAGTRTGIGTLVDMDSLEVEVDVNENFINRVKTGQPVTAKLNAYPDWSIPAEMIAVIPTADRSKATVRVRIGLNAKDPRILPDMGARVSFLQESAAKPEPAAPAKPTVTVPAAAVLTQDGSSAVFVVQGETVERRAVQVGIATNDGLTILSGLSGGETLAVTALDKLGDETVIKITP